MLHQPDEFFAPVHVLFTVKVLFGYFIAVSCTKKGDKVQKKTKGNASKRQEDLELFSKHDELMITQILNASSESDSELAPRSPPPLKDVTAKRNNHPQFGGKQPKQHKPPKCINVGCKNTKKKLEEELASTKEKLQAALNELSKRDL